MIVLGLCVVAAVVGMGLRIGPRAALGRQELKRDSDSEPIKATLQIASYVPRIIFDSKSKEAGPDPEAYQRTQMALMRSNLVLIRVVSDPKIAGLPTMREQDDPVFWLQKNLQVEYTSGSMIISVSLKGGRVQDQAPIINSLVDSYMQLIVNEEKKERITRLDYLRKLWLHYIDELKTKREMIRDMVETAGSANRSDSAFGKERVANEVRALEKRRSRLRLETIEIEAKLDVRKEAPDRAELEERLAILVNQVERIDRAVAALARQAQDLSGIERDMKSEQAKADIMEATARKISNEIRAVEVELQAPPRIKVLDSARPPKVKGK